MRRVVIVGTLIIWLSACAGGDTDDLQEFVTSAHTDLKPKVEPIPEMKPYEPFQYGAVDLADPFAAKNLRPLVTAKSSGPRPDMNRRKEALEDFPLDALKMVGTLSRKKNYWAIIQTPDGSVHRAQVGNHIGQNFGKVIKITDEKVELLELISGPSGDWVEREASLAIVE